MKRPFDLLVFDWDGTLMDSISHIVGSMRKVVDDLSLAPLEDEHFRDVIGLGLREAICSLYPDADDRLCSRFTERYRYHYLSADRSVPFPGVEAMLRELADQGYLLAVATGKGRNGLDRVLQSTGLTDVFHATRCADECRSKPHPDMLLHLMNTLGVEPNATLMIGDSEHDMNMALNAGTEALAVSYGVHSQARLQACNPLGCLENVGELLPWLDAYTRRRQGAA